MTKHDTVTRRTEPGRAWIRPPTKCRGPAVPAAIILAALATMGCFGRTVDSSAPLDIRSPGKWTAVAPMPTARQEVAAVALGGRLFVIGGFGGGAEAVGTVEVYDPAADRWEARAPLPAPTHHAAAAVLDGHLFVAGGYTGRASWTPIPMPMP